MHPILVQVVKKAMLVVGWGCLAMSTAWAQELDAQEAEVAENTEETQTEKEGATCPECPGRDETFSDGLQVQRFLEPPKLRPCCMLGYDLRTTISNTSIPVKVDNILYPNRLGTHSYRKLSVETEQTGLIYTCRGGIVDIAHIRDYADTTAYLYERIRIVLGSGVLLPIPDEGGKRWILLRTFEEKLSPEEHDELALLLAERISFMMSVWHEIVTWYDYRSMEFFSERASAFSPEDLYSNLLGAKIGAEALRQGGNYDEQVTRILDEHVHALVPLPNKHTKETLNVVDGIWWDSSKKIPDMRLIVRRNMEVGDTIAPWRVPDAHSPYCGSRKEKAALLDVPTVGPKNIRLEDLYEFRFTVDPKRVRTFLLPDGGEKWVTQADFPWIIENIRRDIKREFGPFADKNGLDAYELGVEKKFTNEFDPEFPCGRTDPDCSLTRREEIQGVKIGNIRMAGGNMRGMMMGATLAKVSTTGGRFNVMRFDSVFTFAPSSYLLHVKAVENEVLLFCRMEAEDGSGRVEIDYPFVNPFATKCVPNSWWGIKLDMLEMLYESDTGSYGFRPLEFGIVLNALGNGHTPDFLHRSLLFSMGLAPEIVDIRSGKKGNKYNLTSYFSMIYDRNLLDNRMTLRAFSGFRYQLPDIESFNVEGGGRVQYNHLWSRRDFRGGAPLHSIVTFGVEASVTYFYNHHPGMPSMLKYTMAPMGRDFIPANWHIYGQALVFFETTIPKLGMF